MSRTTRANAARQAQKLTDEQHEVLHGLAELMAEVFFSLTKEERDRYMVNEQLLAA